MAPTATTRRQSSAVEVPSVAGKAAIEGARVGAAVGGGVPVGVGVGLDVGVGVTDGVVLWEMT